MPCQYHASTDVSPSWHTHTLVDVLHERILGILGEQFENVWDCSFGVVEDRDDRLEGNR